MCQGSRMVDVAEACTVEALEPPASKGGGGSPPADEPSDSKQPTPEPQPGDQRAAAAKTSGGSCGRRGRSGGDPTHVAAREVVGRQLAVWSQRLMDWPRAVVAQYDPDRRQHLVRYLERAEGEVKHEEQWVTLGSTRFQWLTDPPPAAAANPTSAGAPKGDDTVGWRVKVFWPGMARWYQGRVQSYDPRNKRHKVKYRDGDVQELSLRDEAVLYLEAPAPGAPAPAASPAPAAPPTRERERPPSANRDRNRSRSSKPRDRSSGGGSKQQGQQAGGPGAARKRARGAEESGGEEPRSNKSAKSSSTREEGVNPPPTASPPKEAPAPTGGSHDGGSAASGESGEDFVSAAVVSDNDSGGMPSGALDSGDADWDAYMTGEEEEDSDYEVESHRGSRRRGALGASGSGSMRRGSGSSRRASGAARRAARKDSRPAARYRTPPEPASAAAAAAAYAAGGASGGSRGARGRARPDYGRRVFRPKHMRADDEAVKAAGTDVVGGRVAVLWFDDQAYYKGKLIQFDGYHKRHKILYDDGEEEWVSLTRESFRWLTPRGRSAGCGPAFRAAMYQLGAEGLAGSSSGAPVAAAAPTAAAASPSAGDAAPGDDPAGISTRSQAAIACCSLASAASPTPQGEVAAVAPKGESCVGWQLSVHFEGDGQWYRGEVIGFDRRRGRHLVLYDDGEDEWLNFEREDVAWHSLLTGPRPTNFPGIPKSEEAPKGEEALGWRVGVFWPNDLAFYSGEVVGYDEADARHEVAYDDGEEGTFSLQVDRVKWILPPGMAVNPGRLDQMDTESMGAGGGVVRSRRRGGEDSDPDYEFETRARAAAARRPPGRPPSELHMHPGGAAAHYGGGGSAGVHPWDEGARFEPSDASPSLPQRHLTLPRARPHGEAAAPLGPAVVVRRMTRVPTFGSFSGEAEVQLAQPITVRIYMSSAADAGAGAEPPAAMRAGAPRMRGTRRLQARMGALRHMARRVDRAQQTTVKGVPTPLPPLLGSSAGRGAGAAGQQLASPTAQRHAGSGAHRLARPSAVNYSPFHHAKRPHPADSEPSSSSGSSDDEGFDSDGEAQALSGLSPRCVPKGGKIKPLAADEEEAEAEQGLLERSLGLGGGLTSVPGDHTPALSSPFRAVAPSEPLPPFSSPLGPGSSRRIGAGPVAGEDLAGGPGGLDPMALRLQLPESDSMGNLMSLSRGPSGMVHSASLLSLGGELGPEGEDVEAGSAPPPLALDLHSLALGELDAEVLGAAVPA